jgi:hypothetical protein
MMPAAKKRKVKDKEAATPAKATPEAVPVPVGAVRKEIKFTKRSASKKSPQKSPQKSLKAKKSPQAVAVAEVAEGSEVAEQEQEAMVVDGEGAVIPDSQKQPTPIPKDPEGREDQAEESEEAEENGE